MRVVVPFAAGDPKTRLADTLDADERFAFARAMLDDVLEAVRGAGQTAEILATEPLEVAATVTVDERSLSAAVNGVLEVCTDPVAIVMADLPLVTPVTLDRLFTAPGEVVLAAGRAGGTNALLSRHPAFRVDYHGTSYLDHLAIAHELGVRVYEVDSHRLATDVDDRDDLVEVLLHGEGRAREWLVEAGFHLDVSKGEVTLARD